MKLFDTIAAMGHEQLVLAHDKSTGYRGIIAIHDTTLGPALGGTRFWNYASDEEAITDALRLARGMTYKNAVAGLNLGGGKSVIIGDNRTPNREMLFRAHGRFVDSLGGRYVTAEDVGTGTLDMDFVHMETNYVAGMLGKSGDPSPVTARGVFRAMQATSMHVWGTDDLRGRTVAIQGCGNVGYNLAKELHAVGAKLIVADIDAERVKRVVSETGARAVTVEQILDQDADILAPCALGGGLNDDTIPKLRVQLVVGAANNQLLEDRHGTMLQDRGITYAPDYVVNAGGVINVYSELAGWDRTRSLRKADEIYQTILGVFDIAKADGVTPHVAADRLAERRIQAVRGMTRTWPPFPNKSEA
jgi:leucine dehydrogenase